MSSSARAAIRLLSVDLDGTVLGNPESAQRFKETWERLPRRNRPLLVYNTGRSLQDTRSLIANRKLPEADYIIGGVGTEFHDPRQAGPVPEFVAQFGEGWNLELVEEIVRATPGIERQPPEFLHPYKSSWFLNRASRAQIESLTERLLAAGLQVSVVYSSLRHLDVLPAKANKGNALSWLCTRLGIPLHQVLVAGDTGNDSSMFLLPGVQGIVVENAQPELFEAVVKLPVFVATKVMADGVLEGLKHFEVIPAIPPPEPRTGEHAAWRGRLFGPDAFPSLRSEDRDLIAKGYEMALAALRKNITPLGFSACSLTDNTVTGTDANYRSVWARDGCFTLVQTVEMNEPDIRAAQRATLVTLLDAMAPNGQIPANVRIDDRSAEYTGVGGICSIDSGLWLVIAVYHYVTHTHDMVFLSDYAWRLQRVMDWLSAHDSNNDGLIEVPEAGDWTDLFGRSYHVLYDEVLWYRANVCYGRLLEYQRDFDRASDYLRWSQLIAGKIKAAFWPSTRNDPAGAGIDTFANRQASLGDTQYLLAEITPFAFNWRCDVLGNVLAFLTNCIDVDRARTAFRFMWGVGVSQPWPVANLYPAVQAGDPDWRPYYTVNLLNLPHHYHNGGIWPFIGGLWVRFIHRLGLHDIALHELVKLAQINRMGATHEWEFNEWVHGKTGLPMGKAFQAWSAAAYLRACQELHLAPEASRDE